MHQEIASAAYRPRTNGAMLTSASTATQITAASTPFETATFYGFKAVSGTAAPTNNGATIWIGEKDAGGTLQFMQAIAAGASWSPPKNDGAKYDLKDFWVLTPTSTDGVAWLIQ